MTASTQTRPVYRFRPGALDHIMRSRNLRTDSQLAALLLVSIDELAQLRAGAEVTPRFALRVSTLQGDENYISGLFDMVYDSVAA
ncbi:hypothetical protein [Corynebacterium sp. c7Ub_26]